MASDHVIIVAFKGSRESFVNEMLDLYHFNTMYFESF